MSVSERRVLCFTMPEMPEFSKGICQAKLHPHAGETSRDLAQVCINQMLQNDVTVTAKTPESFEELSSSLDGTSSESLDMLR